jgi:hypothetical protein
VTPNQRDITEYISPIRILFPGVTIICLLWQNGSQILWPKMVLYMPLPEFQRILRIWEQKEQFVENSSATIHDV